MNDLTPEWAHYHACQRDALSRSARGRDRLDPAGWGLEAALDRSLSGIAAGLPAEVVTASAALAGRSAARLERSRAAFRESMRLAASGKGSSASERSLSAASDLRLCLRLVSGRPRDVALLGAALASDGAVPLVGLKRGTYRVALMRLRARLAAALAV